MFGRSIRPLVCGTLTLQTIWQTEDDSMFGTSTSCTLTWLPISDCKNKRMLSHSNQQVRSFWTWLCIVPVKWSMITKSSWKSCFGFPNLEVILLNSSVKFPLTNFYQAKRLVVFFVMTFTWQARQAVIHFVTYPSKLCQSWPSWDDVQSFSNFTLLVSVIFAIQDWLRQFWHHNEILKTRWCSPFEKLCSRRTSCSLKKTILLQSVPSTFSPRMETLVLKSGQLSKQSSSTYSPFYLPLETSTSALGFRRIIRCVNLTWVFPENDW